MVQHPFNRVYVFFIIMVAGIWHEQGAGYEVFSRIAPIKYNNWQTLSA
jgi:hypothetical protein